MTATSNKLENFAITKKHIEEASSLGAKVNQFYVKEIKR
jgi:hypothetical protein